MVRIPITFHVMVELPIPRWENTAHTVVDNRVREFIWSLGTLYYNRKDTNTLTFTACASFNGTL